MKTTKKVMAFVVAVLIVLSCAACGTIGVTTQKMGGSKVSETNTEQIDLNDENAIRDSVYQKVIQQTVNKYGVFDEEKAAESYNLGASTTRGLIDAETCDITGDGKNELFLLYADKNIYMNVYEYENGAAQKKWSDVAAWGGVFAFALTQNDKITTWVTYESVATPRKMYTYKDDRYIMADGHEIEGYFSIGSNSNPEGIMLNALASELGIEDEYSSGSAREIMAFSGSGTLQAGKVKNLVSRWSLKVGETKTTTLGLLSNITYHGDKSKCKMTKEMALAYADAIESEKKYAVPGKWHDKVYVYATLMDLAGDGMPLLLTVFSNGEADGNNAEFYQDRESLNVWTWNGQEAVKYDFIADSISKTISNYAFYPGSSGEIMIRVTDGLSQDVGSYDGILSYTVSNAQLKLVSHEMIYSAFADYEDNTLARGQKLPGVASAKKVDDAYVAPIQDLLNAGWVTPYRPGEEYSSFYAVYKDGSMIKFSDYEKYLWYSEGVHIEWMEKRVYFSFSGFGISLSDWTQADTIGEILKSYAKIAGKPVYSYDDVYTLFDDSVIKDIAKKIAEKYNGEIGEIYRLSDDLYYVIIYIDDEVRGTAVIKNTNNGKKWKFVKSSDKPLSEGALSETVNKDNKTPNIKIDFEKTDEGVSYIDSVLQNIDGTCLNPSAQDEIVKFIGASISKCTGKQIKFKKNTIVLSAGTTKSVSDSAIKLYNEYLDVLNKYSITLDKPITVVIQFVVKNADIRKPVSLKLTKDILDAMGNANEMTIVLGSSSCSINVARTSFESILNTYGEIIVIFCDNGNNNYTIQYTDANGNIIEKLDPSVAFALPASNENCTVLAEYAGGTINWGGQYDRANGTLLFEAMYSGTYTVLDKKIDINDIDNLTEEQQKAIRFMVSKGYFEPDDKMFNPDQNLTRYDFAKALVKMSFALDNDAETTFSDVTKENPYYPYVASGETKSIIEGYEDKTFRGTNDVLREEVIALCSRTLKEYKGYSEPENPQLYLHFTDKENIQWGHSEIALAVRQALIDDGGELNPQSAITRADAALILYRLFMLLYEVKPVAIDASASSDSILPWAIAGAAGVVAIIGAASAIVLLKRKKQANELIKKASSAGSVAPEAPQADATLTESHVSEDNEQPDTAENTEE